MRLKLTNKHALAVRLQLFGLIIIFLSPFISVAQTPTQIDSFKQHPGIIGDTSIQPVLLGGCIGKNYKSRQRLVAGINIVVYGGTLLVLNEAWYKGYPRSSFHVFDDSKEWLQVDKVGHAWSAYSIANYSTDLWRWAGLPHKKAVWIGGLSGAGFLTIVEMLDAHSEKWGWSWADMGANVLGSGLFISQELLWKEQRVQFKFSSHAKSYDASLKARADDLFGKSFPEKMLKDYNGQTYWLSFNLKSFLRQSNLPAWLNISVGYGAEGMLGGFENKWTNTDGSTVTRYDITRRRQFYISPDIDLTKIKTNSRTVRTLLNLLNIIKVPAPALEFSGKGLKGHLIYF